MKITTIDHITINCIDIKKSCDFYENVIGLSLVNTIDLGEHVLHLYQLPGAKLELIEYKDEQKLVQTGNTDVGVYRHIAFRVDDLNEALTRCEKAGYGINLPPTVIEKIGKNPIMLIVDPNGVEIELIQA
jgi:catechol 2,3-dioxygenase-like lactoylglutathione lyase family enzyme